MSVQIDIDIDRYLELLKAGADVVPPAIIAVFLLAGPTAAWLLYRFVVMPRAARARSGDLSAMWVCARCLSVNELRMSRCYRCDARPNEADVEVIDTNPAGPAILTPVGPGLDLDRPAYVVGRARSVESSSGLNAAALLEATGMPHLVAVPDLGGQPDTLTLPDVAAMTEVTEAPRRRRSPRTSGSVPVGPGRPEVARPRRAVVVGQTPAPDDPSAA